jgi:predicted acyltransferase
VTGPSRFASVDALRGLTVAAMLLVNDPGDWGHVYWPLLHSEWNGCTPTDLVFPFFLFIVGVSIALGIVPRVEAGADTVVLRRAVLFRAAKIVCLGLVLHALSGCWTNPGSGPGACCRGSACVSRRPACSRWRRARARSGC